METQIKRIYTQWLPTSGYELTEAPEVHFIHSTDNLLKIKTDPENILNTKFEIWLPVKKRQKP
ncbi:MAG: GyrI-like domain-containing protein [Oscillospiraceae bacterium]|nr:GyrI-like domain-containing protein [Oscillospiraceae bacterium]